MAQDAILENPSGAFKVVADFTLGLSASGEIVTPELRIATYRANATITAGQCLMFVAPTTTVPVSVTPMTSAAEDRLYCGTAFEAAAAGSFLRVVIEGHCLMNFGATTPAAGNFIILPDATTGVYGTDATPDVDDSIIGINWGVKDANNLGFGFMARPGLITPGT